MPRSAAETGDDPSRSSANVPVTPKKVGRGSFMDRVPRGGLAYPRSGKALRIPALAGIP